MSCGENYCFLSPWRILGALSCQVEQPREIQRMEHRWRHQLDTGVCVCSWHLCATERVRERAWFQLQSSSTATGGFPKAGRDQPGGHAGSKANVPIPVRHTVRHLLQHRPQEVDLLQGRQRGPQEGAWRFCWSLLSTPTGPIWQRSLLLWPSTARSSTETRKLTAQRKILSSLRWLDDSLGSTPSNGITRQQSEWSSMAVSLMVRCYFDCECAKPFKFEECWSNL